MLKTWTQWKVGIAGARKAMRIRNHKSRGTLVCARCGSGGHFALFEGGLGKCCFKAKRPNVRYTAKKPGPRAIDPRIQTPETIDLKRRIDDAMAAAGIYSVQLMARELGITPSRLYNWYRGHQGQKGQRVINPIIAEALDRWTAERADALINTTSDNIWDDVEVPA